MVAAAAPATRPGPGLILARGAGWGAAVGLGVGILLPYLVDLATFRDTPADPRILIVGLWWTGPAGAIFGAVTGLVTGGLFIPFAGTKNPTRTARIVAAVCGPVVAAGLMYLVFHPRLEVGANETAEHLLERIVMFYVIPPGSALVAGALLGHRLARPEAPVEE